MGERRGEPVHARVLPPHPRAPRARRAAGAVVPALRDRPFAGRLGDARAGRGVPALRGVRAERPRPADRRRRAPSCRCRRRRRCSSSPGLAKELWTVHVLSAGDLDARYLGGRALLEPLFASYGMPANSDYAPLLDQNAARHRFTERSATDLVALLNADVPLLEMLEPTRSRRPVNPLFQGALRLRAGRERAPRLVRARLPDRAAPPGARGHSDAAAEGPRPGQAAPDRMPRAARVRLVDARPCCAWRSCQSAPRARRRRRGMGAHPGQRLLSGAARVAARMGGSVRAPSRARRAAHGGAGRGASSPSRPGSAPRRASTWCWRR